MFHRTVLFQPTDKLDCNGAMGGTTDPVIPTEGPSHSTRVFEQEPTSRDVSCGARAQADDISDNGHICQIFRRRCSAQVELAGTAVEDSCLLSVRQPCFPPVALLAWMITLEPTDQDSLQEPILPTKSSDFERTAVGRTFA